MSRLRLPPPSDPPESRPNCNSFGRNVDLCPRCPHSWHGLPCRGSSGTCLCQTSIEGGVPECTQK